MINNTKEYYEIPNNKPFIRCDYEVAMRSYDPNIKHQYHIIHFKKIDLLEKCRLMIDTTPYPRKNEYLLRLKQKEIRDKLGITKQSSCIYEINSCHIKKFIDIKSHIYIDKKELDKIKIGEKVYIIREYNTHNNNDDFSQYTIYDAICYRKFNDYVEWCTSTQANCHKNIIKNYYRIKKLENILND